MSLLPSRGPETSTSQDGEIQVVGVDEDVAAVLDALSSETARDIVNAVYDEPGTPSEIADRLDMSIQKVSYHLEKLEDEELITVAGTQYSEKGQEMTVYEPPEDPLVVFVGTPDRKRTLRSMLERLVPAVGLLTAASVMVQVFFGQLPGLFGSSETTPGTDGADGPAAANGSEPTPEPTPEPTESGSEDPVSVLDKPETPNPEDAAPSTPSMDAEPSTPTEMAREATETAADVATGGAIDLEPGVAFFLGGLLVLAVVGVTWAYTE